MTNFYTAVKSPDTTPPLFKQYKIAVIIPAYNVQDFIQSVLNHIPDYISKIIVVNDASTDQTEQKIRTTHDPRIVLINHSVNSGVGAAMLSGYKKALDLEMDILIKMDGDGQMKSSQLTSLIEPLVLKQAHYAKGNRFTDYKTLVRMPFVRRFGNAWLSFLTKCVSGYWNIFDVTNGFTAILAQSLRKMDLDGISKGYFFETSMLIELNIIGAKVVDVDMPSQYSDEPSHMRIHRIIAKFPILLIKGYLRRFYRRYLIRDFNALSLCLITGIPLFAFGILYALSLWVSPPISGEPTPAGTVMLAALPIIMGFQLILTALILDMVFTPNKSPSSPPQ